MDKLFSLSHSHLDHLDANKEKKAFFPFLFLFNSKLFSFLSRFAAEQFIFSSVTEAAITVIIVQELKKTFHINNYHSFS